MWSKIWDFLSPRVKMPESTNYLMWKKLGRPGASDGNAHPIYGEATREETARLN